MIVVPWTSRHDDRLLGKGNGSCPAAKVAHIGAQQCSGSETVAVLHVRSGVNSASRFLSRAGREKRHDYRGADLLLVEYADLGFPRTGCNGINERLPAGYLPLSARSRADGLARSATLGAALPCHLHFVGPVGVNLAGIRPGTERSLPKPTVMRLDTVP